VAIGGGAGTRAGRCTVGLLEDLAITTLPPRWLTSAAAPQVDLEVIVGAAGPPR
jgi:hypothetical protein